MKMVLALRFILRSHQDLNLHMLPLDDIQHCEEVEVSAAPSTNPSEVPSSIATPCEHTPAIQIINHENGISNGGTATKKLLKKESLILQCKDLQLPFKGKLFLLKLLELHNKVQGNNESADIFNESTTISKLKEECIKAGLPPKDNMEGLKLILELYKKSNQLANSSKN